MSGSNENAPSTEPLVEQPQPFRCTQAVRSKVVYLVALPLIIVLILLLVLRRGGKAGGSTHTFTVQRATTFANLAGAAYCSDAALEAWSCGGKCIEGLENVHVCAGHNTKAFVAKFEGQGFVSFSGSLNLRSTFQELLHDPSLVEEDTCETHTPHNNCSLENGVWHEWVTLEKCIEDALVAIGSPTGSKIKVAGHSMGGAVASVGMYAMVERGFSGTGGWEISEAYTFGSPRPGNKGFSDAFGGYFGGAASAFYRVTYHLDPFPHLPLEGDDAFVQLAPEVFFETDFKSYRMCPERESSTCSGRYGDIGGDWGNLGDHIFYMGVNTSILGCVGPVLQTSEVVV